MSDEISCQDGVLSYAELIPQLQRGNREAFAVVVAQWQEPLFRIAYRILGSVADAVDVRQTVFLRLMESPQRLPEPDKFAAWIRRCAINESLRYLRRSGADSRAKKGLMEQTSASQDDDPANVAVHAEEAELLRMALERLQPDQRVLLALRFDEGLTFQQMANVSKRPVTTVKSQSERAIRQLRTLLNLKVQKEYVTGPCSKTFLGDQFQHRFHPVQHLPRVASKPRSVGGWIGPSRQRSERGQPHLLEHVVRLIGAWEHAAKIVSQPRMVPRHMTARHHG